MGAFLRRQWFVVSLALVLGIGLSMPGAAVMQWLADADLLRNAIVATVLLMTSLVLNTRAISNAVRRPTAVAWAVLVNAVLLPLVAWGLSYSMTEELSVGLMATAAAPCTIASAAVWTRRAGGNDAIAILVTVVTNAAAFLIAPFWMRMATGAGVADQPIDAQAMMIKLLYLVLLPMLAGQALRLSGAVARWSHEHRGLLANVSQIGILFVVLVGSIRSGERLRETAWSSGTGVLDLVWMLVVAALLHVSMLVVGQWGGRWLGLAREDWIATGFAGSQKTLMVGLVVALQAGGGLSILPIVAYHVLQLLIDTLVADRLAAMPLAGISAGG